jgi:HEAT repeat protein
MNSRQDIDALLSNKNTTVDELRQLTTSAVPTIIDIFLHDASEWNERKRLMALRALGVVATKKAHEFLVETAQDAEIDHWFRTEAVRSLGYAKDKESACAHLESMLDHPDFQFRKNAILALADLGTSRAREALEKARDEDPDERLRQRAARLLGEAGTGAEEVDRGDEELRE